MVHSSSHPRTFPLARSENGGLERESRYVRRMTQTDEFGEELADFVRRVAELKTARSVSGGDLPTVLDAAIFELDHVVGQLWPRYERLTEAGPARTGASADRQEQQLLRTVFQ